MCDGTVVASSNTDRYLLIYYITLLQMYEDDSASVLVSRCT